MPALNSNVTMPVGHKTLIEAVLRDTRLGRYLDGLKRSQGNSWPRTRPR